MRERRKRSASAHGILRTLKDNEEGRTRKAQYHSLQERKYSKRDAVEEVVREGKVEMRWASTMGHTSIS